MSGVSPDIEHLRAELRLALSARGVDVENERDSSQKPNILVAVSGGADSLALLLLMHEVLPVRACSFDHGLRDSSADEVCLVAKICNSYGIAHQTERWQTPATGGNIQAKAREARYAALSRVALNTGCRYIATAHHRDDQAETMLMRLLHASGVRGLSGMRPCVEMPDGLRLIRPFLNASKQQLVNYLTSRGIDWVEDPSNENVSFERIRLRNLIESGALGDAEMVTSRVAVSASRVRRADEALSFFAEQAFEACVTAHPECWFKLKRKEFLSHRWPDEIRIRVLTDVIQQLRNEPYTVSSERVEELLAGVVAGKKVQETVGGVRCASLLGGDICFVREAGRANSVNVSLGEFEVQDIGRTIVGCSKIEGMTVKPLGAQGWKQVAKFIADTSHVRTLPMAVREAVTAIYKGDKVITVPEWNILTSVEYFSKLEFSIETPFGDKRLKTLKTDKITGIMS